MVSRIISVEAFDLVVFGGTGDLAHRKLFPALFFAREEPTEIEARVAWRTDDGSRRSRIVRHDLDAYRDFPYLEVPRDAPAP